MGWFVWDPCGLVCASFAYTLIVAADYGISRLLDFTTLLDVCNFLVVNVLLGMAAWCHWTAMTTNPGTVPVRRMEDLDYIPKRKPELRDGEMVTTCKKCPTYKPFRAHHCSTCGRCVRLMDHHCPWVNNCVGEDNQKFFILFVFYICLGSFYVLGMLIHHMVKCDGIKWKNCSRARDLWYMPLVYIGLFMEGIVFGLFTCIMGCDQMCGIMWDETGIEKMQHSRKKKAKASSLDNLKRVFGARLSYKWLIPVRARPLRARVLPL